MSGVAAGTSETQWEWATSKIVHSCWQDSCPLVDEVLSTLLATFAACAAHKMAAGFIKVNKWERARDSAIKTNSHSFCNLNSEVTSHHFCCILFVRGESLGAAHTPREVIIQDVTARRRGHGVLSYFVVTVYHGKKWSQIGDSEKKMKAQQTWNKMDRIIQIETQHSTFLPFDWQSTSSGVLSELAPQLLHLLYVTLHVYLICLASISLSENNSTYHIYSIDIFKKILVSQGIEKWHLRLVI